jgi:HD superfamily phosphohydrolase
VARKPQSGKLSLPLEPASSSADINPEQSRFSSTAERQELFLPVSGFVWFYPEEIDVINHPAFQRLSRINQLGMAYLVFRGATHKRFEHALGAVHVIQRMTAAVEQNCRKADHHGHPVGQFLSPHEERFVRLGALLHDIGHLAAGHTLEDELGLIGQHDGDDRLDIVFNEQFDEERPEPLRDLIDRRYGKYLPPSLEGKITATDVVRLLIRKRPVDPKTGKYESTLDRHSVAYELLRTSSDIRLDVGSNMIGNTICADLLDYLFRDWYHVGKPRTFDDRVLQYMEIRAPSDADGTQRSSEDRFVVALGNSPRIRSDGVSAILDFLEWRYQLAETVLFHRTKLAAAAMLDRALFELWEDEQDEKKIIHSVLQLSDEELIDETIRLSKNKGKGANEFVKLKCKVATSNLNKIKHRNLFTGLKTWTFDDLSKGLRDRIRTNFGAGAKDPKTSAAARTQTLRELESDFQLTPGSLAMYLTEMKPKIAEVSISVDGVIQTFAEYEGQENDRLSGGQAQ